MDIDGMRDTFFKISLLAGYHNAKYSVMQLMLMILACIRGRESFEEGAKAPSAQTLRDRLHLDGEWLEYFHACMWALAEQLVKYYRRPKWWISIDEVYEPFFGNRKKLNEELVAAGFGKMVHGYRAKTPGATGSFCYLVVSLCCWRIRLPIAIRMMAEGEPYQPWLEPILKNLRQLVPHAKILADRGFGKSTWFHHMIERLGKNAVIRIPLRKKSLKKKVERGQRRLHYWMTDSETKEKALLTVRVAKDKQDRRYIFAIDEDNKASPKQVLTDYLKRWDLENIFKDSERVQLPTSSRNPLMRLFCVVLSFFLFVLWQVSRLKGLRNARRPSLRQFVKQIITQLCSLLGCLITQLGQLVHRPP